MSGPYPRRHVLTAVGGAGALLALGGTASARNGRRDGASGDQTIVDFALSVNAETGEFSTLVAALVETGLVAALSGRNQLTVFAPTDAAFAAAGLDADNVGDLDTAVLTDILLYHVTRGRRYAASLNDGVAVKMLNGDETEVSVSGGVVVVNDANVVTPDLEASNGVVHVIGGVLTPPE
jgi:uncharacterized surface protein with fasciclin (FAS1) repeats